MPRALRAAALALVTLAASGCVSTDLTQIWRDPAYRSRPVKRVFIVAEMHNQAYRAQFEDALAQALTAKGFQTATSTGAFPPGPLDKYAVADYVKGNSVDLVIRERLSKHTTTEVVPSTVTAYNGWYGGGVAVTSGYVSEDTTVVAETGVFDVKASPEVLVWMGKSSTFHIQGAADAAKSLSTALVNDLMQAGILVK